MTMSRRHYVLARARRRHRHTFDFKVQRRSDIERHARRMQAASTEDFDRWLVVWAQHNARSKDPVGALMMAAQRMGGRITKAEAVATIDYAKESPRPRTADSVARQLGLTYRVREELGITTIGSIDIGKRARKVLRQRKARLREEARRRRRGAKPQSESLSQTQPWKALGISRRTWYRRQNKKALGTTSCAPFLSISAQEVVPAERPRGDSRAGARRPSTTTTTVPPQRSLRQLERRVSTNRSHNKGGRLRPQVAP